MIPRRVLHLKNGVIRPVVKPPSTLPFASPVTISIRTGRRHLGFLEAESAEFNPRPAKPGFDPAAAAPKSSSPSSADTILPIEAIIAEQDTMNPQKEAELLTMQHVLGLKDAADETLKPKPKDLERLQRLKAAEPVFVCVDLEAFEFAQEKITEVGISILDSRYVVGTDPGAHGMDWLSKIKTRHIIIKEHKHLVNKRFVHGCPDKFNFGDSEIVPLRNIHKTLTQLFDNPSPDSATASDRGPRNLILVGHGLSNDTAYLNKLNFAPHAKGNIILDIDTQKFVGSKKQTVGLSKLMVGLGVDPENLHNAGNDAAYTMQGLILMTVQHTNNPGAYVKAVADAKAKVDPAKQRYKNHKAVIREKKLAQQMAKLPKTAPSQPLNLDQDVSVLRLVPDSTHKDRIAATKATWNPHLETGPQQQPEVSTGPTDRTSLDQDLGVTIPQPLNPQRPPPTEQERIARRRVAQTLPEMNGWRAPFSPRLSIASKNNLPTPSVTMSGADRATRNYFPGRWLGRATAGSIAGE